MFGVTRRKRIVGKTWSFGFDSYMDAKKLVDSIELVRRSLLSLNLLNERDDKEETFVPLSMKNEATIERRQSTASQYLFVRNALEMYETNEYFSACRSSAAVLMETQSQRQLFLYSVLRSMAAANKEMVERLRDESNLASSFVSSMDPLILLQEFILHTLEVGK